MNDTDYTWELRNTECRPGEEPSAPHEKGGWILISVLAHPAGEGARVAVWARKRYQLSRPTFDVTIKKLAGVE